jgi:carboxypeptidase family protein
VAASSQLSRGTALATEREPLEVFLPISLRSTRVGFLFSFCVLLATAAIAQESAISKEADEPSLQGTVVKATGEPLKKVTVEVIAEDRRVVDEDSDPMPNVEVSASRKTCSSRRQQWRGADGSERTNDLGEYRIGGLLPGQYFVTASPPPTFLSMVASPKDATQAPDKPETGYVTTYYPGTTDHSQAATLVLHAGDEMPVDFSLMRSRTFHIRGTVANLPAGANTAVILHSCEAGPIASAAEVGKDGRFELRGVSSGVYSVVATVDQGETVEMARQTVRVVASDVEGVRLLPTPGTTVKGQIRADTGGPIDFSEVFVSLQAPGGESGMLDDFFLQANSSYTTGRPKSDGTFEWKNVASGTYNVQVACDSPKLRNCFLKSVIVDGRAASDTSLSLDGGTASVGIVLSDHAGEVEGTVVNDKNEPLPNAQVVAVPDSKHRKITDRYQKVMSDQRGHFVMRTVVPGTYTLFAWDDLEGEPYYDVEFLKAHESEGQSLRVQEGGRENVVIKAGSAASRPQ